MIYKSKITINEKVSFLKNMIPTPTMSEILWEEFMEPMGISAYRLAKDIHVPVSRIQEILRNKRKVTVDTPCASASISASATAISSTSRTTSTSVIRKSTYSTNWIKSSHALPEQNHSNTKNRLAA